MRGNREQTPAIRTNRPSSDKSSTARPTRKGQIRRALSLTDTLPANNRQPPCSSSRESPSKLLKFDNFSWGYFRSSLHFVGISLHFPKLQGETGWHGTASTTTHSFEPRDFPETSKRPGIGGLRRRRFGLRGDLFRPGGDFGQVVSGPRNPVSRQRRPIVAQRLGSNGELLRGQAEHLVLAGPFGRQVGEADNAHAMREPSFDRRLDEVGREEGKRDRHVDLAGRERLEAACSRALEIGASSYSSVNSILKNNLDRRRPAMPADGPAIAHDNIRGPTYFH
jgi:hypothetical protein